ncbi:hypothetical protein [Bernardetia sp. MNP-M8]|uniref:hypothetical protein n=1 Tax=Bernardetia sp. MNP-M8 TaxID=3127470 RepID=UPI0030D5911C
MKSKISKRKIFLISIFSIDTFLFCIISIILLALIYFTDADGNTKNILPLSLLLFIMAVGWVIVLHFYTLSLLKKIFNIIESQGFTIYELDFNSPPKIMIKKNEEEFFLALTSISIRGTYIIVDQKYDKDSSSIIEKKTLHTRYDSIKKLNTILKEMTE